MATTVITVTKSQAVGPNKTANITFNKVTIPQYYTFDSYRISINSNPGDMGVYKYNTSSLISTNAGYAASTAETNLGWTDGGNPKLTVKNKSTTTQYSIQITITFTLSYVERSLILNQISPTSSGFVRIYANGVDVGFLSSDGQSKTVKPGDTIRLQCRGSNSYVFDNLTLSPTPSDYDNYQFTMPDSDISMVMSCVTGYSISLTAVGGEGNTASYSAEHMGSGRIKSGDVVTIFPNPAEGYIFKKFEITNVPAAQKLNKTQFIMPSAQTVVVAYFVVKPNNVVGYYNGTEFIPCTVNYYDGTEFVECEPYYYDGTDWIPISTT